MNDGSITTSQLQSKRFLPGVIFLCLWAVYMNKIVLSLNVVFSETATKFQQISHSAIYGEGVNNLLKWLCTITR